MEDSRKSTWAMVLTLSASMIVGPTLSVALTRSHSVLTPEERIQLAVITAKTEIIERWLTDSQRDRNGNLVPNEGDNGKRK